MAENRVRADMRYLKIAGLTVLLAVMAASSGAAHSLKQLENQLGDREKYFQPLDKPAPDFELRDADGRAVRLADFRGKVVVLHFIYTNCPDVCPLHAERIADIQRMINQTPMKDQVRFVSVTTDPENDTPNVLRDYGPTHGLDAVNWKFLTSGPDRPAATRALAERFGHKFIKQAKGYQLHSVVTHVIDREGKLRANFYGLRFDPTSLVLLVNALTNGTHRPERRSDPTLWERFRNLF
jgi:protein SCO1